MRGHQDDRMLQPRFTTTRILLCPIFFASQNRGAAAQDSQACTLVREAGRLAASTEVSAYPPRGRA
jgi:hypothetical protein